MKVKDTSFDLEKFIALVKARTAIYAVNNRDHHNRQIVDALWAEIAQEMQKTVIECKAKWHQLRNNFARELRCEKNFSKRSIWYLRRPLSFLTENILESRSKRYRKSPKTNEHKIKQNTPKLEVEVEEMTEETFEDTVAYEEYNNHQESSREVETYETVEEPVGEAHEIKAKLDEREEDVNRLNDERNADLAFFQSLFPDIQKLSARRKRKFKETILVSLNRLVDEEEEETVANYPKSAITEKQIKHLFVECGSFTKTQLQV